MTIIYLKWRDAAYMNGPLTADEVSDDVILESVGWIVKESDLFIVIASDWDADLRQWRYIQSIPKVLILDRQDLKSTHAILQEISERAKSIE